MPKLRVLSAADVLRILGEFGFRELTRRGSHIKLRRTVASGASQTLTVPYHKEIDRGTLYAVFRQACRYIPESELRPRFFTE